MLTVGLILLSVILIIVLTARYSVHPFLALLAAALIFGLLSGMSPNLIIKTINEGFGSTIGSIGIIIIAGIIIGAFLENTGGAYALANRVLNLIGHKNIHAAMAAIGYIISVPVFADSGFIILAPLNKALSKKAGLSLAGTVVALSLGLMSTHTLVPPTPGPIAAAGIIKADIGLVILIGLIVSLGAVVITTLFARKIAGRTAIDPDPKEDDIRIEPTIAGAPSAFHSFLPIAVPVILIVFHSIAQFPTQPFGDGPLKELISFAGNPVTALFVGMLIAFTLPKKLDKKMLSASGWVGSALKNAAIIILITGAGGAFGKVLQQSDIAQVLGGLASDSPLDLWLPFLIAAGLKTAQGSSTVAIITTASIIVPLMPSLGLEAPIDKAMTVVAIGAGSSVVSHANDSFFWVMTQMSNMTVKQGYKLLTLGSAVLGFSAMSILTLLDLFL